jgi:phosphoesterase RecJ-like protein
MALAVPGEVIHALDAMRRPIMLSHVVPDADALGSMLSMALAWSSDECAPRISLPAPSVSQRLSFLVGMAGAAVATPADFAQADGFVALDAAKKGRCNIGPDLRETDWSAGRRLVNIDHHATNTRFGDVNWIVDGASSTCEMVYCLLRAAERPVTTPIPSLLFAGVQTDTLGFSLPTTSPSSLACAAELVALGADVAQIGERLCRSRTKSEFDLLRVVYANTRVIADGRIAYSSASLDEIHGAGCTAADIDDQINVPRSVNGAALAMLFTEGERGKTRINFRGSGEMTVADLAAKFGGGGHRQSAGAIVHENLHAAMSRVLAEAVSYVDNFQTS